MTKNIEQAREAARAGDGKFGTQPASEVAGVALNEPASVPPLTATVQPQAWQRDYAVDAGDPVEFEVGDILAEESDEALREFMMEEIRSGMSGDLDELYFEAVRRGRVPDGFGPFNVTVDPDDFAKWEALREVAQVPPTEFEAVRAYIDEVDPDDWGSDHAIDYELSQKHVLLHYLEAGTAIGDLAVSEDTYMVSTRDPHGDVTEAFFVKEPAVNDLFNAAIDKCDAEYMKSIGG